MVAAASAAVTALALAGGSRRRGAAAEREEVAGHWAEALRRPEGGAFEAVLPGRSWAHVFEHLA